MQNDIKYFMLNDANSVRTCKNNARGQDNCRRVPHTNRSKYCDALHGKIIILLSASDIKDLTSEGNSCGSPV